MPVVNRIADMADEIAAWRRDFHQHPELQFDVHRTAGIVAEKLRGFGVDEVVTGIGRTGVVGVIRGRAAGSGRVVGLRADMDALPIVEATGAPHASKTPGKMHACGHDGHTAMLLGAARHLAETRNFDGTAVLIFQPAEEGGGGARAMVADGVFERFGIQQVYGMHNMPGIPAGQFAIRPGPIMAAVDLFHITIAGKGGHGAMPHHAIDPNVAAASMLTALQSIVSRNLDPLGTAVVTVATITTDSPALNVIPQVVKMSGAVRTFAPAAQEMVERRMGEIVANVAAAFGARGELDYRRAAPATVNDADAARRAADVAAGVVGEAAVDRATAPQMASEDFSFMLNARPGAFIFIGNGDTAMVHHPEYDFNDEIIPAGCSYWSKLVEELMPAA